VDQRLNGKIPKVKSKDDIVNYASFLDFDPWAVYFCKPCLLFVLFDDVLFCVIISKTLPWKRDWHRS
jgi:hypothetical protein